MPNTTRNVVVVVVDALRRDRVGLYDEDRGLTPNIDALGDNGTVFNNAFACTNTTDPSITTMHTGRDPETVVKHHGPFVTDLEKRRAETVETVPEILQDHGLHTIVTGRTLGRWHARGFDYYPIEKFDRYKRRTVGSALERIHPRLRSFAGNVYESITSVVESSSNTEVDEFLKQIKGSDSFYGFIHMMDTHVPYSHDEKTVERFLENYEYPNQDFEEFLATHGHGEYVGDFLTEHSDERDRRDGLARWFAKYDAAVRQADAKIGSLIEGLRDRGRLDETTIVVTSDHGESLDEHGIYFDHHGLYDQQVHVPLICHGPSIPDARRDELVQLYDLGPTTLDILGADTRLHGSGRSLAPLLGGSGEWRDRDAVFTQEAHAQSRISIRTREYKYIKYVHDDLLERERGDSFKCGYCNTVHGEKRELFDLETDSNEQTNLVDEKSDVAERLDQRLSEYFDSLTYPDAEGESVTYEDEEELMARLEDLGYR